MYRIGLFATVVYVAFLIGLVFVRWDLFSGLSMNEWGDFLAGFVGPVALLWVVLSFLLQSRELQNSVNALNLQAKELRNAVDQHKKMVGITEKQLDLDIEVREEQNLLLRAKGLPLFQVSSRGNSGVGGSSKGRAYRYQMKNIGAAAASVVSHLNYDDVSLRGGKGSFLDSTEELGFEIHTKDSPEFPEGKKYTITIVSQNIRGQERTQVFSIGNFQPRELSCNPERL